jgi:hypothetical protein
MSVDLPRHSDCFVVNVGLSLAGVRNRPCFVISQYCVVVLQIVFIVGGCP